MLFQGENLSDFKGCQSNEENLVIGTGGEGEGEKLIWRFALPGNWTQAFSMKDENTDHYTKDNMPLLVWLSFAELRGE